MSAEKLEAANALSNASDSKTPSTIPDHRQVLAEEIAAMSPEEYEAADKKLLAKLDRNLVPWMTWVHPILLSLWTVLVSVYCHGCVLGSIQELIICHSLLFTMSFLDRINIGTAKLAGLTTDLNLTSLQYNTASMSKLNCYSTALACLRRRELHITKIWRPFLPVFFVSYVALEVPSNLVLKKFRPSRWIPLIMIVWSLFQIFSKFLAILVSRSSWTSINTKLLLVGFVTNYGQLLAMRFCLGMAESGLFPGISFFLSGWYRRKEASKRISLFFAGAVLAGAFGGIFGCKWSSILVSFGARY